MNVIDVTPRPAALSAIVRFLQSRVMTILGILFILTAFKWGTLLFVVQTVRQNRSHDHRSWVEDEAADYR
jgi:hypothetical protein